MTLLVLLIALAVISMATFAWYIYNTSAHTTKLRMAAGSSASLMISNAYDGTYGASTVLASFTGKLDPVSTNKITNGFQKVVQFEDNNSGDGRPSLLATLFGDSVENQDYYKTSLYIKSPGRDVDLYVNDIKFEDSDSTYPVSTAIRVGFVVHKQGKDQPVENEYIFSISNATNPAFEYNTFNGQEGHVLDSSKKDGSTVAFTPYTSENYCDYTEADGSGVVTLKEKSLKISDLNGAASTEPVQVDVYIWLEGCDQDCTISLLGKTLKNVALAFAGY